MDLKIEEGTGCSCVAVDGRIDTTNAGEFEKSMLTVVDKGAEKVLLDCTGLSYISSSGLRVLLILQKKLLAMDRKFILCSLQPVIREVFDISGFTYIFTIKPDVETGLRS